MKYQAYHLICDYIVLLLYINIIYDLGHLFLDVWTKILYQQNINNQTSLFLQENKMTLKSDLETILNQENVSSNLEIIRKYSFDQSFVQPRSPDIVVFPQMIIPLFVGRERSIKALDKAVSEDRVIFLSAQKKANKNEKRTFNFLADSF